MRKIIVIDASIVVKWFNSEQEEDRDKAYALYRELKKESIEGWVPTFFLIEIVNIFLRKKHFSRSEVEQIIEKIKGIGLHFVPFSEEEIGHLTKLSDMYSLSSYDALYILLAKEKNCQLITVDRELLEVRDVTLSLNEWCK